MNTFVQGLKQYLVLKQVLEYIKPAVQYLQNIFV